MRIGSYGVWGVTAAVGVMLSGLAVAQDGGGSSSGSAANTPAAGSSFGDSVKGGWDKFTHAMIPESRVTPAPDATALATPAKPGPELYVAIGRVAEQQGKFDQAEEQYQRAIGLSPKHLGALMAMARLRDRQNRFDEAMQFYHRALQAYPKEAGIFNDLGLCLAKRQMYPDSITAMRKAIQLQPQKPLYHNNLASVLVETGDMEGAYAKLRAVHEEPEAYYDLGYLMFLKGNRKAATALFTKALQEKPSLTEARLFLEKLGPLPAAQPRYSQPVNRPTPPPPGPVGQPYYQQQPVNQPAPQPPSPVAQPYYPQPVNQPAPPPPSAVAQQRYPEPATPPNYPDPAVQPRYPEPATQPNYPNPTVQPRYPEPVTQPNYSDPTNQPRYPEPARSAGPLGSQSDGGPNVVPGGPPNDPQATTPPGASPGPSPSRPFPLLDPIQGNPPSGPEIPGATSVPRLPPALPQVDGPRPGFSQVPYMASRPNVQPRPAPDSSPPNANGPQFGDRLPGNVVPLPPVHENEPGL